MQTCPMSPREKKNAETAYRAAAAGMVLLENRNHVLPIEKHGAVALYGVGAVRTVRGGTGSGDPFNGGLSGGGDLFIDQSSRYHIHIYDAFEAAGYRIVNSRELKALAENYDRAKQAQKDLVMHTFAFPEPLLLESSVREASAETNLCIFVLSRNSGEGSDRKMKQYESDEPGQEIGDYLLSKQEIYNLNVLRKHFAQMVVVLNTGGIVDVSEVKAAGPDSILLMGLAGQEGGRAVRDILNGTLVPTGKLTDTWASCYADYPASATFAGNDGNTDLEKYAEGILVGYRYFDSFGKTPVYPFGYGIGYTDFDWTVISAVPRENLFETKIEVINTGACPGAEVLQVYASAFDTGIDMPVRELRCFQKTRILLPQEKQMFTLSFLLTDLEVYDPADNSYKIKQGVYLVSAGNSSRNTAPVAKLVFRQDIMTRRALPALLLDETLEEYRHTNRSDACAIPDDIPVYLIELPAFSVFCPDAACGREEVTTYTTDSGYVPKLSYEKVVVVPKRDVTWQEVMNHQASLADLAAQMSDEELAALNCGTGWGVSDEEHPVIGENSESVPGAAGETTHILEEKYGIPSVIMADGPGGIRVRQEFKAHSLITGREETVYHFCTAWPSGTLLAQSFDPGVLREVGAAIAVEMREIGVHILLAPGMNIHRDPLCGRNFEYYSEDPLVSGLMAAAFTDGVQKSLPGVGVCIKHYAANNQETNRSCVDEWISQRALREIYLKGFEIAVKRSSPFAVMTSYNLINKMPTADSHDLCTKLLRGEWGFQGFVMTDWNGGSSTASKSMHAGNDLIMPGGEGKIREILLALKTIPPVFDKNGQILFTRYFGRMPFYEEYWNSFTLDENGPQRCRAVLEDGYTASVLGDRIVVNKETVFTRATSRFVFMKNHDRAEPFHTPLTVRMADIEDNGKTIAYHGSYNQNFTICRGDLQQCALRILSTILKITGGETSEKQRQTEKAI